MGVVYALVVILQKLILLSKSKKKKANYYVIKCEILIINKNIKNF